MERMGIKRLVSISGAVIAMPGEELEPQRVKIKEYVTHHFKEMLEAQEAFLPQLLVADCLEWTYVRVPMIEKGRATGRLILHEAQLPGMKIILEDLARFAVGQINSKDWIRRAPIVCSEMFKSS